MSYEKEDFLSSKKRLKWFESRIENFNSDVSYQINTLNTYKNNIKKQYRLDNLTAVRQERISAERSIRNLKQMLIDIERLKEQVMTSDYERFDKLVFQSVGRISNALKSFDEFYGSLSLNHDNVKPYNTCTSYGVVETEKTEDVEDLQQKQILLEMQEDAWELENQKEIAEHARKVEQDVQTINEIFRDLAQIISVQKEVVTKIDDNVEISHAQVVAAEKQLVQVAAKLKGGMYPLLGALLGSCVGGPIGFMAGLKVGAMVAVTGSLIGFSGGRAMKLKQQKIQERISKSLEEKSVTA